MSADPVTLTAIASIIGAGTAAGSAMGMFGDNDKAAPKEPTLAAPNVMPTPDDDAAKKAKMRQATALSQRRGRESTILSEPVNTDLLGA